MDEWLSVGDEGSKHKAQARPKEVIQSTRILALATHSRKLAMNTHTRAIGLHHGRIKMDATPHEVYDACLDKRSLTRLLGDEIQCY